MTSKAEIKKKQPTIQNATRYEVLKNEKKTTNIIKESKVTFIAKKKKYIGLCNTIYNFHFFLYILLTIMCVISSKTRCRMNDIFLFFCCLSYSAALLFFQILFYLFKTSLRVFWFWLGVVTLCLRTYIKK